MKVLCEKPDSRIYLDGDQYIMTKEHKGEVRGKVFYPVKDWKLCPLECYEKFGYKIVDMEYVSALYDERRANPDKFASKIGTIKKNDDADEQKEGTAKKTASSKKKTK